MLPFIHALFLASAPMCEPGEAISYLRPVYLWIAPMESWVAESTVISQGFSTERPMNKIPGADSNPKVRPHV